MENIHVFNYGVRKILEKLYKSFPVPIQQFEIRILEMPEGVDADSDRGWRCKRIYHETMCHLSRERYLLFEKFQISNDDRFSTFREVVLTEKGRDLHESFEFNRLLKEQRSMMQKDKFIF